MFFFKSVINSASHQKHTRIETMSSRTTTRNTTVPTPYCKVCHDAGKPASEYTSHFVKDQPGPDGKVVCPTLLNQACRICHKTGHTSSYCSQYKSRRDYREEPRREQDYRREERYIPREEPRREQDYRREERYIPREEPRREQDYRREERYIPREEPRRDSYDRLREDTERREQEIRDRDNAYYREQDRQSKPWLQAALKKQEQEQPRRREPYAHPHGPRTRLNLEATALCASKHAVGDTVAVNEQQQQAADLLPSFDVRKVHLNLASNWADEDAQEPFVCDPEKMFNEFAQSFSKEEIITLRPESDLRRIREKELQHMLLAQRVSEKEFRFIEMCDNQNEMPFECGQ
jgi:hypothetical protein